MYGGEPTKVLLEVMSTATESLSCWLSHCVPDVRDRKSTRLNSSHLVISYAVFCLKKKTTYSCSSPRKWCCSRGSSPTERSRAVIESWRRAPWCAIFVVPARDACYNARPVRTTAVY